MNETMPISMAGAWQTFEAMVLDPIGAEAVQRHEMRRAFYCGAQSFFDILMFGLDPDQDVTEADEAKLAQLHEELLQFGRAMQEGRA